MRYLYTLLLIAFCLSATAQTSDKGIKGYAQGYVYDTNTKETIPYATVRIITQQDSTQIQAVATDTKGRFNIPLSAGNYIIDISFIGYKSFLRDFNISNIEPIYKFGDIFLEENSIALGEMVIEAKIPDIVVKGDTIEYNAGAYSSQESDMLQDMVKNIPGIEIDNNGNITANGKPVQKILVDGKEFFGNDIPMALANLPANMIKKLQLYKQDSETAQITGFKDKEPEQVLNLVVKEELKQSIFGDIKAGFGSDNKYAHKALINYMRNGNQISVVGDIDNVSDNDYPGGMSMDTGIDKNKNVGANTYFQASEKLKIGGNIRYSRNENLMETKTNTQTFLSSGDRFSKQNSSSSNMRENFNMGINLQWKPDSLTTVFARSYVSLNNTESINKSENLSFVAEKDTTSGHSITLNKGNGYNVNNYLTIGRKLNDKGRTISLTFNNSLRKDDADGTNYSFTQYTGANPNKEIDQLTRTNNKSNSYNISMSYVEPLGKDYKLQLIYSYNRNGSERIRDVRKKDASGNYNIIDTAYTRKTKNDFINQNISLNFQAEKEKYRYTIGVSIDPSNSKSKVNFQDSIIEKLSQNVVNFSPSINFTYMPNDNSSFDFSYSGSTSQPSISQLSADTVIVSALSKRYGNPNLKPSYRNNMNLYYQKSNYETGRFLMVSAGFNYTFNNIVDYILIDSLNNRDETYRNINGNMGANINFMFDTPLRNKKFTINNTTYSNYYKNIGYTNGQKAITHNIVLNEQVTAKFKSSKFETSLRAGLTYSMVRNNLSSIQDRNTTNYNLYHFALLKLPFDFSIQSSLSFSYYTGYEDDFKNSEVLWNASISKQFLKKKKATLKAQFFDILNDRNNITRIVTGSEMSDSRSNTVNQYFMISFSYKFNFIKSKGKKDTSDDEYYEEEYY